MKKLVRRNSVGASLQVLFYKEVSMKEFILLLIKALCSGAKHLTPFHFKRRLELSPAPKPEYTMVDRFRGGRKLDMLTSGYVSGPMLESVRHGDQSSRARWHKNKNQQNYSPPVQKRNVALEFRCEELGINRNMGRTTIGL